MKKKLKLLFCKNIKIVWKWTIITILIRYWFVSDHYLIMWFINSNNYFLKKKNHKQMKIKHNKPLYVNLSPNTFLEKLQVVENQNIELCNFSDKNPVYFIFWNVFNIISLNFPFFRESRKITQFFGIFSTIFSFAEIMKMH